MSKRGPGSELNHENWNDDGEIEEAGIFKKAPEREIQGRVIKKARRRNAGTDGEPEKKHAFAGFGGFSTTSKPASAAEVFGNLGKSPSSTTAAEVKTGGFGSFGGTTTDKLAAPVPSFGSFGSAEPAKPSFGSFSFQKSVTPEVSSAPAPEFSAPKAATSASSSLGDLSQFKAKAGSWSCDTCMVSNAESVTKCAACETPKPGSKPDETPKSTSFGESGGFKFGGSGGSTGSGFSFGAPGSTGGFSFGGGGAVKTEATEAPPQSSGFTFGMSASDTEKSNSSSGPDSKSGFSFGIKSESENPAPFGQKSPAKSASNSVFGSAAPVAPSGAFSFGSGGSTGGKSLFGDSSNDSLKSAAADPPEKKPPTFLFGGTKPDDSGAAAAAAGGGGTSGFTFGGTNGKKIDTEPAVPGNKPGSNVEKKEVGGGGGEFDHDYLAHLAALNIQVTEWIKSHVDKDPLVILSTVFKDYEEHLKDITAKFPPNQASSVAGQAASPAKVAAPLSQEPPAAGGFFSFGAKSSSPAIGSTNTTSSSSSTTPTAPFSFGTSLSSGTGGGFSFGASTGGAANPPFGGGFTGFSGLAATNAANAAAPAKPAEAEEEEDTPPVVEIKQVVEDDALYSKKCKLFYKKDADYMDKGVGMLYLKKADNGKIQLLVRADTNLGNILLNIILNSSMPTTRVGKNNVMLVCIPNPPIDPKADTNAPTPMLIRVKTSDDADELKSKLDEYKAKED